jgi:hypothetical protein
MAWNTGIVTDYIEGLGKQVFIRDTIGNGMFPCQSDIVKTLRSKKQNWMSHEFYEYRMFLTNTNTGGGSNSQLFTPTGALRKPGQSNIGVFRASYGVVADGFNVDMIANIETKKARAAFANEYSRSLHSTRMNCAAIFKNVAINGKFGVVHKIMASNVTEIGGTGTPAAGTPFTLVVPSNVYASGFFTGRLLIKTTTAVPWGPANTNEIYIVLDNQPHRLTLVALPGSTPTKWEAGQYLELSDNRKTTTGAPPGTLTGSLDLLTPTYPTWAGTGDTYTSGPAAQVSFMEGLADLFPWYTDASGARLGLDQPFRGQPNRQTFTTQTAGGFYQQGAGEGIMDAILAGVRLSTLAVPYEDVGVWMNHDTRLGIAAQEAEDVRVFKKIEISQPIIFQRGVTATTYTIGSKEIPDVISDDNLPTDTVIIGPKKDMSYCCLDNSYIEIDNYIQNTFSKEKPPRLENLHIPEELSASLNLSRRIVTGAPVHGDGRITEGGFVHPSVQVPVSYYEMGNLYTDNPYCYVVVKLQKQIINPAECANW